MSSNWRSLLVVPLLAAGAIFLHSQTHLNGFWVLKVPTGDGNFRESYFELQQSGDQITGKQVQGRRETAISAGTFQDGKLHFVLRQTPYDGVLDGGKINMHYQPPNSNMVEGVMERSGAEAARPPRLPLPELHDVPDNGLARTPPMGWNSWNKFAGKVDDAAVRGMADAMVSSGMSKVGYQYINIDDTWEGPRDAKGNITTNRKFPDMKALADYVHSKGLKIGIYSSPGPKTCAGYEGTYGHEDQDAKQWAAWGFDYIKYDWCSADQIYTDQEMQPVYQKMGDALRKTGRPIVFSLCQYGRSEVWKWGAQVGGNLWRTTGDISDRWNSMDRIGSRQFDIAPFIKPGHWNDPDMLEIGNGGMTNDEYKTHMSLWSMLAAPLLAGNDLRSMSDDIKAILMNTDVIAVDQDKEAHPVKKIAETESTVVLARPLAGKSTAIGFFNRGDQPAEISVNLDSAGLTGKKLVARDLWLHQPVQLSGDHYSATVPTHGVVMLKVTER
ncbi:MAG TPA: glycoside hydrolase family 27 protein [Bryobacteraceae bacterium]|nr:glycoside hydrolase family 27 protein [Bryobacteraceae bacterium]